VQNQRDIARQSNRQDTVNALSAAATQKVTTRRTDLVVHRAARAGRRGHRYDSPLKPAEVSLTGNGESARGLLSVTSSAVLSEHVPEREVSASQRLAWERLWELLLSAKPVEHEDICSVAKEESQ